MLDTLLGDNFSFTPNQFSNSYIFYECFHFFVSLYWKEDKNNILKFLIYLFLYVKKCYSYQVDSTSEKLDKIHIS